MSDKSKIESKTFDDWWDKIGSGLRPNANEDREEHMRRVAKAAVEAVRPQRKSK